MKTVPINFTDFRWLPVSYIQKQPPRGGCSKRCSENIQQTYRRTPMPKCDSIKLLWNFIEIILRHECSPLNLLYIIRTPFSKNTSELLALYLVNMSALLVENSYRQVATSNHSALFFWKRFDWWSIFPMCQKVPSRSFGLEAFDVIITSSEPQKNSFPCFVLKTKWWKCL